MQTFLPYADFQTSASVLDRARLGKQRVEAYQLLLGQFPNHPAAKMWKGFEGALSLYALAICDEWIGRGYKDTVRDKILGLSQEGTRSVPPWFGRPSFHLAHQSNLVRKNPSFYRPLFGDIPDDIPYEWG